MHKALRRPRAEDGDCQDRLCFPRSTRQSVLVTERISVRKRERCVGRLASLSLPDEELGGVGHIELA